MLARLQQQGDFEISPADLLAVQKVLQANAQLLLTNEGRTELQFLLAPILCKSQQQQTQFYQLYQTYLAKDLKEDALLLDQKKKAIFRQYNSWIFTILGLLIMGLFLWWNNHTLPTTPNLSVSFEKINPTIYVGDTLIFQNTSTIPETVPVRYEWTYTDKASKQVEAQQRTRNFAIVVPQTENSFRKQVQLKAQNVQTGAIIGTDKMDLALHCKNPPSIKAILVKDSLLLPEQPITFSAEVAGDQLSYNWNLGDGTTTTTKQPTHIYAQAGNYAVSLTVRDTLEKSGKCDFSFQTYLNIIPPQNTSELVSNIPFTLQKEPPEIVFQNKAWTYILLWIFLVGMGWCWLRWLTRPILEKPPAIFSRKHQIVAPQSLQELIQPTFRQFEMANSLRHRQPSSRKELALAKTVQTTIEKGGYAHLKYHYKTQPTEYIALIPQQAERDYPSQLFHYLLEFFAKQDVLLQIFYYQKDFGVFYNDAFQAGLSQQKLATLYPQHRLLIFGNHQRIDLKKSNENLALLNDYWPNRIFCTYATISKNDLAISAYLGPLFSASLEGIQAAIQYLQQDAIDVEDKLAIWETTLASTHSFDKPDKLFLKYPELVEWFEMLILYPEADLATIIAIGKALGQAPTFDNLQLLYQIAQAKGINLDDTQWTALSLEKENIARKALIKKLQAQLETGNSTNDSVESIRTTLIIQQFALESNSIPAQRAVRYLYQQDRLSDWQLRELDYIIQRRFGAYAIGKLPGETFIKFLDNALKKEPARPNPWNVPYFWGALAFTLLTLGLTNAMYFLSNDTIKDRFEVARSEAARLNNLAVQHYTKEIATKEKTIASAKVDYNGFNLLSTVSTHFLQQAVRVDSAFEKAHLNQQKLFFNDGLAHYQAYQTDENYPLAKAKRPLQLAINYATFKDSTIHFSSLAALAAIHHLLNERDSVCFLIQQLEKIKNTERLVNIAQLQQKAVYCAQQPVPVTLAGRIIEEQTQKPLLGVRIAAQRSNTQSNEFGQFQVTITKAVNQLTADLNFYKSGYQPLVKSVSLTSDSIFLGVFALAPADVIFTLKGKMVNKQTGQTIPNAPIGSTRTDAAGYFNFELTPENEITKLVIEVADYQPYELPLPAPDSEELVIQLVPKARSNTFTGFNFPVPETVLVPGGTFTMGCTPEQEYVCELDERPAHQVQLDSFEIGKYEVTNAQFSAFLNDYGAVFQSGPMVGINIITPLPKGIQLTKDGFWQPTLGFENHPAVGMTQYGASEYCHWLSQKTNLNWRLPTEAEWEYAARGGPNRDNFVFSGSNAIEIVAWCYVNSFKKGPKHPNYGPNAVGQLKPNSLGIYDMSGNIFEFVLDHYQADFYEQFANKTAINPIGPLTGERVLMRGGSWYLYSTEDARVADRIHVPKHTKGGNTGFRVVRLLE